MPTAHLAEKKTPGDTAPARPRNTRNTRKLAMRIMLGTLGVSLVLGFAGKSKAHVATGLIFGALLADHVWTRRKAL